VKTGLMKTGLMEIGLMKKNRGVGLVELMISVTIGLLVMSGVLQLYASSQSNANSAQGISRIQENMRYVFGRIGEDIMQAGNIKCATTEIENIAFPVSTTGTWQDFDDTYVSGVNRAFNPAQPFTTSDTLIIKRVDYSSPYDVTAVTPNSFTVNDANNLANGTLAVVGDCSEKVVLTLAVSGVNVADPFDGTVALVGAEGYFDMNTSPALYVGSTGAYTYSIGNSTGLVCSDAAPQNCSLFIQRNADAPQELAQGVYGLQVRYGVNTGGQVIYSDAYNQGSSYHLIDRVEVTLQFNSASTPGSLITRSATRVYAIRSAW
jgi:type IV pilus assembly protein PilW